jgi:thiol-disulfide isomerase/thioredoxin
MICECIPVLKKSMLAICVMLVVGGLVGPTSLCKAADAPPPEGGVFPNINFPVPEKPEEQQYLGLEGKGTFTVSKIQAKVVILEIFSMYCPFCQKEAPNVKALHRMIEQNEDLKKQIKMLAVGAGNSPFEVNTYTSAYGMAFPHFADTDFSIHDALGKVRTPYFIVIKLGGDGPPKVIYSKVGGIGEPRSFLELIAKASG